MLTYRSGLLATLPAGWRRPAASPSRSTPAWSGCGSRTSPTRSAPAGPSPGSRWPRGTSAGSTAPTSPRARSRTIPGCSGRCCAGGRRGTSTSGRLRRRRGDPVAPALLARRPGRPRPAPLAAAGGPPGPARPAAADAGARRRRPPQPLRAAGARRGRDGGHRLGLHRRGGAGGGAGQPRAGERAVVPSGRGGAARARRRAASTATWPGSPRRAGGATRGWRGPASSWRRRCATARSSRDRLAQGGEAGLDGALRGGATPPTSASPAGPPCGASPSTGSTRRGPSSSPCESARQRLEGARAEPSQRLRPRPDGLRRGSDTAGSRRAVPSGPGRGR